MSQHVYYMNQTKMLKQIREQVLADCHTTGVDNDESTTSYTVVFLNMSLSLIDALNIAVSC